MKPRKIWSRLARMSGDELLTRLNQATQKQLDLAAYRSGLVGGPRALWPNPALKPEFFFHPDEIENRAALLRSHLPNEADAILREADAVCRHRFNLLGYQNLDFGTTIDWHLDAVHHKRAPLKPWFRITFLDFAEAGDHKVIWELNRHQHLLTLAKAWCLTSDRKYADELQSQWYQWQKANPYPLGVNWASALEVAFRSFSWLWIKNLLANQDTSGNFASDLLAGLRQNGRYIERYHSKYFSPNTHLIGEAVGLFFIGTLCPEIPEAKRWQRWGWNTILEESIRQVRPDGVYFEQSLYYHVYALDFFLYARVLAARNGIVIPERFDDTMTRMLDFVFALTEGGPAEGFGDDDGGRVFNPGRNRIEHMTDPLAIGGVEYQRSDWASRAELTEEAIWLFGENALALCTGKRVPMTANSQAFESGGVYLIRDREPMPQQMMIDAGPQGNDNSGHGHADALSIRFSLAGHRCLIDPGSYAYISPGNERTLFRGTGAHNTLRVDGMDQAIPEGPFAWSSIPTTQTRQWINGETFNLFEGEHDGYKKPNDPVVHRRIVFHAKGAFWLVRDVVEGSETHSIESFWHFAPEFHVSAQQGCVIASLEPSGSDGNGKEAKLALLTDQSSNWKAEIIPGEVSAAYGAKQAASVARLYATTRLPAGCTVLVVPLHAGTSMGVFERNDARGEGVRAYRYHTEKITHHVFFSQKPGGWKCGAWSSDARLLYARLDEGRVSQFALLGGSFARWQEITLVSNPQPIERFEWVYSQGGVRTSSSSPAAEYARDNRIGVLDPVH